MEIVRSINNLEYMCDALADASACASSISKITDKFILITYENANLNESIDVLRLRCRALFYIGKLGAEIMFNIRPYVSLVMQAENIEEAVMLASQFNVGDVNKIVFIPCVNKSNGLSIDEMVEDFKNTVNSIK